MSIDQKIDKVLENEIKECKIIKDKLEYRIDNLMKIYVEKSNLLDGLKREVDMLDTTLVRLKDAHSGLEKTISRALNEGVF